ncbi:MAG: DUF1360 domain-containing protein [bacterium]|nr:DUF1360 domain-containing protein [bacterium]
MTMKTVIYLSIVCASISFTVTETQLFEPLRNRLKKKNRFLGRLVSCGYCLGHWVAFVLVALAGAFPGKSFLFHAGGWQLLDYFFAPFAVAWLSGFQWVLMCLMMDRTEK